MPEASALAITSTRPSGRLRAHPRTPSRLASLRALARKPTPCTFPETINRMTRAIGYDFTRRPKRLSSPVEARHNAAHSQPAIDSGDVLFEHTVIMFRSVL